MKLYWTLRSIPELGGLDRKKRKAAWIYAYGRCFGHWQTYVGAVISGCCAAFGIYVGNFFGSEIAGVAIGGGIGGFVFSQIAIAQGRRYLVEWNKIHLERRKPKTGEGTTTRPTASPPDL